MGVLVIIHTVISSPIRTRHARRLNLLHVFDALSTNDGEPKLSP